MKSKQNTVVGTIIELFKKIVLIAGVIVVFFKLPSMIAEKISYMQIRNKDIKQDFTEEE